MTTSPEASLVVRRVLVVTAHPDDVDFGAAGAVASWVATGVQVTYCVCTAGGAGGFGDVSRADMPRLRQEEQRAAAAAVGVTDVRFLGYRDGQVTASLQLRRDITRVIRAVRPDRVVSHSPEINWTHLPTAHPDHRAVGEATLAAIYPDARNGFAYPELLQQDLQPWTVAELWMSGSPEERINHVVDVTDYFDAKLAALSAHRSQTGHLDDLRGMIRRYLARNADRHGMPGRLAEAFHVVDTS
ncbi:PIG-L family deacetylase [Saccharopolyspora sp. K220]|uniref:PIG-L deacetylase family protein n=1 Tax=Saccharopolyspora soli TaxID=2926618 RepID=UPI001F59B5EC|nr:PIG-L deacetylase family protein [Saccharopolyspora soli]MCI2419414.1 PIG-L family deacetylase [Saccharopolyspora soli]